MSFVDAPAVPIVEGDSQGVAIDPGATYLITGGLGGLGLAVARWLVASGARNLALVGRRAKVEPVRFADRLDDWSIRWNWIRSGRQNLRHRQLPEERRDAHAVRRPRRVRTASAASASSISATSPIPNR